MLKVLRVFRVLRVFKACKVSKELKVSKVLLALWRMRLYIQLLWVDNITKYNC